MILTDEELTHISHALTSSIMVLVISDPETTDIELSLVREKIGSYRSILQKIEAHLNEGN